MFWTLKPLTPAFPRLYPTHIWLTIVYKSARAFFRSGFWTTFQNFSCGCILGDKGIKWMEGNTVEISTCPPERKVNLISPLILGGNVVKLFPSVLGFDSIATKGFIQLGWSVHLCSCLRVLSNVISFHSLLSPHPFVGWGKFSPTNEKEACWKRILYLRATSLISQDKKLVTKGFVL